MCLSDAVYGPRAHWLILIHVCSRNGSNHRNPTACYIQKQSSKLCEFIRTSLVTGLGLKVRMVSKQHTSTKIERSTLLKSQNQLILGKTNKQVAGLPLIRLILIPNN